MQDCMFGLFFGQSSQHFLSRGLFLFHDDLLNKIEPWIFDKFSDRGMLLCILSQVSADNEEMAKVALLRVLLLALFPLLLLLCFFLQPGKDLGTIYDLKLKDSYVADEVRGGTQRSCDQLLGLVVENVVEGVLPDQTQQSGEQFPVV
jgi:hypothetical protein